jgi:integrase
MGYYVKREKYGWRIIKETYVGGKRISKTVPSKAIEDLGIDKSWDYDRLRAFVKRMTVEEKRIRIAERLHKDDEIESAFLPGALVTSYERDISSHSFGSPAHQKKLFSHWNTVKGLIRDLELAPEQAYDKSNKIYKYFLSKKWSPNYCNKLLRTLNSWGYHCSKLYRPVDAPRGVKRVAIETAYEESSTFRGPADPLTPELCKQGLFSVRGNYEWLLWTIWFGLRPSEVDIRLFKVGILKNVPILQVYQSKLTAVSKEKRYKHIPALFAEQRELLSTLTAIPLKRPLIKTLRNAFPSKRITLYSGRKGFVDLMLDRGQILEDISNWLGHTSIETTWKNYRNKLRISWK